MPLGPSGKGDTPFRRAMDGARSALRQICFFSFFINLLMLTSSIYMLQVYDRVLASRSEYTLLYLTLFAAACLATLAALEVVRSRMLVRMGVRFDAQLSGLVFTRTLSKGRNGEALRDLDTLRTFLTSAQILSLLDAPWMPIYLGLVYVLHPMLGHVAAAGAVFLFLLGLWNERSTRDVLAEAGGDLAASTRFAELSARNSEAVRAMGMVPGLSAIWRKQHDRGLGLQGVASDRAANVAAIAKSVRFLLQIAILGVGAWLVIQEQTTAGVMIAASIIMGRGLAPVEAAIGGWRAFLSARQSHARLFKEFGTEEADKEAMPLPRPTGEVVFESVIGGPPDARKATVRDLNFRLEPGTCLGITGPSGAGKSTLMRLAIGVWRPISGVVRLDGVNIAEWRREDVGPHVGYLPQDIELFPGSIAENIARFGEIDPDKVVDAAQLAGAHQIILAMPGGYDAQIGPGGVNLSGGQRQRIGLARAFYGRPPLIVLDEPTSNLDAMGETAVRQAIDALRAEGRTLMVIAHRPAVLGGTDKLMVVQDGQVAGMGDTAELMPQITRRVVMPSVQSGEAHG
ncbi:type I secretion system permease/ATPase [Cognatazoarcus halotolerans]|uniref:type I secretion system permease/ATPase n=1 Tax=Cognatazoarcus halotolerans TaxID=2686016 RepID=UPI0013594A89|nr:type I secretion system permease/ATPase [Cognatazoarcus halotolerans]MBX3680387.1 type I secretion system permease/ATPase [Rhodocyclaceae bacterium]MCB1898630.1 type I secretion system permease/ATPase [Rhodocyclaceae bacterium]MCP5310843.1 type I secretion system permease/ATPase [Zoogloeaceae bacterium]